MDYHSMKRRELQALCKEHNIPANSANSVLADKLSALLNAKQKPKTRTCMKSSVEITDEGEPAELKRQAKKVRFSPNNDLVEYELRSAEKQMGMVSQVKTRRKSLAKKVDKLVVDSNTVELVEDNAQIPVRVTRSRVQSSVQDVSNNEKKKGRREAKGVEKGSKVNKETEDDVAKVTRSNARTAQSKTLVKEVEEATESVEETVVGRVRFTRSNAQTSTEGDTGRAANPHAKKKTGKQVKTDGHSVEPSTETIDVPVRATRSTRQTLKEDTGNTVTNPQADKKRTRRGMKATDLNNNSSHVAAVDKQEPPKRKSLRSRGVDEDEGDKMEVVNASRATRNSKNKAKKVEVHELEEPLKQAGKKVVNRRKSVLLPDKTEDDPHLDEAVNQPARRNTRRKSVIPKATKTAESPAVERKQSKALSVVIEVEENVTRSGKAASDNDFKEVTSGTPKSRKRRGTPIIEDQIMKNECDSKSPRSSRRSAIKSVGKSVAKKEVESSFKSPMSRMSIKLSVQKASHDGKSAAIRSGAMSSSRKRAKLSGTKQSDSEDHAVNFSKDGAPVAEMSSFKLDEEVTKPEVTPATNKSYRRLTHSAIKSERKEPSQSARFTRSTIRSESKEPSKSVTKEQPIPAQSFSQKVQKFIPDSAVKTASQSARFTRSTIRSESKKPSKSAIKEQPIPAQLFSPEVEKFIPDLAVKTASQSARFTRSTIRSESKEPTKSAIKEQPIPAQLFSSKVEKFIPDPAVNTAPGRITCRGIKHEGNATGSLSEKVGEKKQTRQSALKKLQDDAQMPEVAEVGPSLDVGTIAVQAEFKQPLDEVEKSSPEVAEVQPNSDGDTIEFGSERSKEVTGQTLGDISASESARLPTKTVGENRVPVSGTAIDMESASLGLWEDASVEFMEDAGACIKSSTHETHVTQCSPENLLSGKQQNSPELQNFDAETMPDADDAETVPGAVSDVSRAHNQNEEVDVESGISNEAVNLGTSVLKSGRSPVSIGVDVQENPSSGNDVYVECDDAVSDQKSRFDMLGTPLIGKSGVHDDGSSVAKELSSANKTLDVPVSGIDIDIECVVKDTSDTQNREFEHDQLTSNAYHATDKEDAGGDDSEPAQDNGTSVAKKPKTGLEVSNANKTLDVTVSGIDIDIERAVEDTSDMNGQSEHDQLTSDANHATDMESVGGGDSEPAQNEYMPVAAEVFVRSHDQQPEQSLDVAVDDVPGDTVGQSDSVVDINKDVSSILGDIYDMDVECDSGNEQNLTEADEDFQQNESKYISSDVSKEQTKEVAETSRMYDHTLNAQEQVAANDGDLDIGKFMEDGSHIGASVVGFELLENIKAQVDPAREEAEATPILNTEGEPTVGGIDPSQLMGDIGAHESPITKESSLVTYKNEESHVDTDSDLQTIKEEDRDKQEDARNASTSVDWGDYDFAMDEFEKPGSVHRSADVEGKDDQDLDLQTSTRTGFHIEESSDSAAGLNSSARTLKKDYKNAADEKSNQEVDMLKESANAADMTEEAFKWPGADSAMKSLFATPAATRVSRDDAAKFANQDTYADSSPKSLFAVPAATRISHVRGSQDDAAKFANQDADADMSLKSLFATPAATQICHVKDSQENAAKFANQDTCVDFSLKSLFATPAATQISHVRDSQDDAAKFANPDSSSADSSLKTLFKTPAVTQTSHVKDGKGDAVDFANLDHYSSLKLLFKTPAVTQTSQVKGGQEESVRYANQNPYSSLKSLFATPATSGTGHVNVPKTDAVSFTFPDDRCDKDIGSSRTAAHEFNHQWGDDHLKDFNSETQSHVVQDPENLMHGGPSFEDNFHKLYNNEVGGSIDRSASNTHFEFKQYEFLNEAAGTSHHNPSGLKDNSTCSHELENKGDTPMKGSEVNDDSL